MKIVFFGDSITESGRNLLDPTDLGVGYVKHAAGHRPPLFPDGTRRGAPPARGGHPPPGILARVKEDVIDEHPDFIVLEVGVNDVWCRFSLGEVVTPEQFEANYRELVKELKGTGATLFLVQPYVLPIGDKQRFRPFLNKFLAIIRAIAEEQELTLIPVDEIFTGVTQDIDPRQFSTDGVHPTHRGCRYIADLVIKELRKYLG